MRAQVVVLGDFGRSPRMQYHAISLSQQAGYEVDVVAYEGSKPTEAIMADPKIHLHLIAAPPGFLQKLPRVFALLFKICFQMWQLIMVLFFKLPHANYLLLQNPPCIPTFTLCQTACFLRRTRLVIDWHNYGFTLLALSLGKKHPLVRLAKWYEKYFGRWAHAHLCVTDAMKEDLIRWGIPGSTIRVLHD
eukprot:CAMPEP_0118944252 /NCGR_PEP_ID=MMETSP1169-20130426/39951_1 /TAXON_ID=36882 /ORGANISM="Pyramimonas obovata, Strain CCMP722" /LENGTH=189 /DNA_ID=CAMNT_0006889705 /DNA_START=28 /DNA_END=594 /DNA_ORIENTATION=+